MARIRSVHPGIWTDEAFISVSPAARLLFIGIWNECDDQGAFRWNPVTLKVRLAPMDAVNVPALLEELAGVELVRQYAVGGVNYGAVRNFREWQRPKKPNNVYPMPDEFRTYAGTKSGGSEPELDSTVPGGEPDEVKPASVPHKPDLVPPVALSGGEDSPQEGKGRKKEGREGRKDSELRSAAETGGDEAETRPGSPPPPIRDVLWRDGPAILRGIVGVSDSQARAFLGGLLKRSRDDCARVYAVLREAESLKPIDPKSWLTRAATPPAERGLLDDPAPPIRTEANPTGRVPTPMSGGL